MLFRIRTEQVETFSRRLEDQFASKTAAHLRNAFPVEVEKQGFDDDGLRRLSLRGLTEARRYGVVNEADVERYIECMLILDPKFDTDPRFPWARQALARADLDGEAKMDFIDDYLVFDLRVGC
ncbi:MAG: hypothetical protein P4L85_03635 [Paludisphaera borealis]|uniref:hypothetical protein n=1 Tax=Paludisphaera borealis TaxID=1387353 RepID=UPI002846627D|nr:hypothetical protein [Paludisphaera borealis]MDR3618418.1 hypothetical protein [Paludisphaera borealis]